MRLDSLRDHAARSCAARRHDGEQAQAGVLAPGRIHARRILTRSIATPRAAVASAINLPTEGKARSPAERARFNVHA